MSFTIILYVFLELKSLSLLLLSQCMMVSVWVIVMQILINSKNADGGLGYFFLYTHHTSIIYWVMIYYTISKYIATYLNLV